MSMNKDEILNEALSLPAIERSEIIDALVNSFDFPRRKEVDELWIKESEDRISAYEKGLIKSMPVSKVFEQIENQEI